MKVTVEHYGNRNIVQEKFTSIPHRVKAVEELLGDEIHVDNVFYKANLAFQEESSQVFVDENAHDRRYNVPTLSVEGWYIQCGIVDNTNKITRPGTVIYSLGSNPNNMLVYYFLFDSNSKELAMYQRRSLYEPIKYIRNIKIIGD